MSSSTPRRMAWFPSPSFARLVSVACVISACSGSPAGLELKTGTRLSGARLELPVPRLEVLGAAEFESDAPTDGEQVVLEIPLETELPPGTEITPMVLDSITGEWQPDEMADGLRLNGFVGADGHTGYVLADHYSIHSGAVQTRLTFDPTRLRVEPSSGVEHMCISGETMGTWEGQLYLGYVTDAYRKTLVKRGCPADSRDNFCGGGVGEGMVIQQFRSDVYYDAFRDVIVATGTFDPTGVYDAAVHLSEVGTEGLDVAGSGLNVAFNNEGFLRAMRGAMGMSKNATLERTQSRLLSFQSHFDPDVISGAVECGQDLWRFLSMEQLVMSGQDDRLMALGDYLTESGLARDPAIKAAYDRLSSELLAAHRAHASAEARALERINSVESCVLTQFLNFALQELGDSAGMWLTEELSNRFSDAVVRRYGRSALPAAFGRTLNTWLEVVRLVHSQNEAVIEEHATRCALTTLYAQSVRLSSGANANDTRATQIAQSALYHLARRKVDALNNGDSTVEWLLMRVAETAGLTPRAARANWTRIRDDAANVLSQLETQDQSAYVGELPVASTVGRWYCEADGRTRARSSTGIGTERQTCPGTCSAGASSAGAVCRDAPSTGLPVAAWRQPTTPPAAQINVIYPDGHGYRAGEAFDARWTGTSITTPVRVVVRRYGVEVATVTTMGAQSASTRLTVPGSWDPGSGYQVCASAGGITSCRPFQVIAPLRPRLTISSPSGASYRRGASLVVSWQGEDIQAPVRVIVRRSGQEIATATTTGATSGSRVIEVLSAWSDGTSYQVCATANGGAVSACGNFAVALSTQSTIRVETPHGDAYRAGDSFSMCWTSQDVPAPLRLVVRRQATEIATASTTSPTRGCQQITVPAAWGWGRYELCATAANGSVSHCSSFEVLPSLACAQDSRVGSSCSVGSGGCANAGLWQCTDAGLHCSVAPLPPAAERCGNGVDEDCDGFDLGCVGECDHDPQLGTACSLGNGACASPGSVSCFHGVLWCDAPSVTASTETCNGVDDDCDGAADDSLSTDCYSGPPGSLGVGTCRAGVRYCNAGSFGSCFGEIHPIAEQCGNGADDDCDGDVDCTDANCIADIQCDACFGVGCSHHGTCYQGTCHCEFGFTGAACELCAPGFDGLDCSPTCSDLCTETSIACRTDGRVMHCQRDTTGCLVWIPESASCPAGEVCVAGSPGPETGCTNCGSTGDPCCAGLACAGGRTCGANGKCSPPPCTNGEMYCSSGCTDTTSNVLHCGTCENACPSMPNAPAQCTGSTCGFYCATPYAECDGSAALACETNLATDPSNCGMCARTCTAPTSATPTCQGGNCGWQCDVGHGNCDGNAPNGCETSLTTSDSDCGACDAPCSLSNAVPYCASASCAIAMCALGFDDCDMIAANGCERDITADGANCGSCGHACGVGEGCVQGACVAACASPNLMCGATCVDAANDGTNCGGCGHVCPGAETCASGLCAGERIVQVAGGDSFSCSRRANGSVACWGQNAYGELGDGTGLDATTPVDVLTISNAVDVAAGATHGCAVRATGTVACWGDNSYGKLGDGTTSARMAPVATSLLSGIVDVVAGDTHTCARTSVGQVHCWGDNSTGQLGDGTVSGTPRLVPGAAPAVNDATSLAVGAGFSCAVRASGAVWCWGGNTYGELGSGTATAMPRGTPAAVVGISDAIAVAAGGYHACALRSTGAVVCWGENGAGQLGASTAPSDRSPSPITVGSLPSTIARIAAGSAHSCASTSGGSLYCWGYNAIGQVGDGTVLNRASPVVVPPGGTVAEIELGAYHSCASLTTGSAVCWGRNVSGQLGDGTTMMRTLPVAVLP